MLRRLRIDNLGVFEGVEAEFGPGLNVITGETGAGKTMLLEAMRLICGAKPDQSLIGPRSDETYVEAAFESRPPAALAELVADDEELVLARRLRRGEPSRGLCGGRSCSASVLAEAGAELVAMTGQHAARRLASPAYQLDLLDRELNTEREELACAYREWRGAEDELAQLRESLRDREVRLEVLRGEQEIYERVAPRDNAEEEELEAESKRLQHASELADVAHGAHQALSAADGSLIDELARIESRARAAGEHDQRLSDLAEQILDARERLDAVASEMRDLAERYADDPARLDQVMERLVALHDLRRRFRGLTIDEIADRVSAGAEQLRRLSDSDSELERLEERAREARESYEQLADRMSAARRDEARRICRRVCRHLGDLELSGARMEASFERIKPGARGHDRLAFLLAANPGLAPAPLSSGASGGELSRVNLALILSSTSDDQQLPTYIFDEVDAGIGGQAAHAVAAKLQQLSERAQVIVVTHLAQIAIQADRHLLVRKQQRDGSTGTILRALDGKDAIDAEIARLIGAAGEQAAEATQLIRAGSSGG